MNSTANFYGGSLYVNEANGDIRDVRFDTSVSKWADGEAVYINGNVNMTNATFIKFKASNNQGNALLFDGGESYLSNSTFRGINPVRINDGATVHLIRNNNTDASSGDYSLFNNGILYLEKNIFENVIINNGTIMTLTHTVVLNNSTLTIANGEDALLNATITDDNRNTIVSVNSFRFFIEETRGYVDSTYSNRYQYGTYEDAIQGIYRVNAIDMGLVQNNVTTGTLVVKNHTSAVLSVEKFNEGEKIIITATLSPSVVTGNVTFTVDGKDYSRAIIGGVATLELYNFTQGTYTAHLDYEGDLYHFGCENGTFFVINFHKTNLTITVSDIAYGQTAVANVTTNGNGTVLIICNGKSKEVKVINGTALWNITDLETGMHGATVIYLQDGYYEYAYNTTTFNVHKLNTTVNAVPATPIRFDETETVTVTVNENATGFVKITI